MSLSKEIKAIAKQLVSKKTLEQVVKEALDIMDKHDLGADMDAGFDAGEFSGPAHSRQMEKEIENLAKENGYSVDDIWSETNKQQSKNAKKLAAASLVNRYKLKTDKEILVFNENNEYYTVYIKSHDGNMLLKRFSVDSDIVPDVATETKADQWARKISKMIND